MAEDCHPQTIAVVRTKAEPLGIHVHVGPVESDRLRGPEALRRARAVPGHGRRRARLLRLRRARPRGGGAPRDGDGPPRPHPAPLAGRARRGRRARLGPALRRADGLRRAARRLLRHEGGAQAPPARPDRGRLEGRRGPAGLPPGAADPRAAHPPRQGDEQHLHRAGAAGHHGRDVRGLPRPGRPAGDRATRPRPRARPAAGPAAAGPRRRRRRPSSTRCASRTSPEKGGAIVERARAKGINLRAYEDGSVGVALDETTLPEELLALLEAFAGGAGRLHPGAAGRRGRARGPRPPRAEGPVPRRTRSSTATTPSTRCCATCSRLQARDLSLAHSMIPLGSCTMKLNATAEMIPVTWPELGKLHPFAPADQARGYHELFAELERWLAEITGFAAVSLQPNSGAQGEYAGLLTIRAYHHEPRRRPPRRLPHPGLRPRHEPGERGHGRLQGGGRRLRRPRATSTSPTCAQKAEQNAAALGALMVTYPSTHGVFEEAIREICQVVHDSGGQVYMDGANMNAQVGLTRPGDIGADVCHLNLHKTFCIPHGGGGPGMGPIAVAAHLAPFLPGHPVVKTGGERSYGSVAAAPWGSASILCISWVYIRTMGGRGPEAGDPGRDPQRQLHGEAARGPLTRRLHRRLGPRGARVHPRRPRLQEGRHRGRGHREAADGLRLPRAHDVVAGGGDADGRAHGERVEGGARPLLRRDDRDPPGDPGRRGGPGGVRKRARCGARRTPRAR